MRVVDTVRHYVALVWCNITIEPVVVLYLMSMGLNEVIRPNLLLDKACYQKLNLTDAVCQNLNNDSFTEGRSCAPLH